MASDPFDLPDHASLIVHPAAPPLGGDAAAELVAELRRQLERYRIQGRVGAGDVALLDDGAFLLVAWLNAGEGMSGCRRDQMAKAVGEHAPQLLTPPPIWLRVEDRPRGVTQTELRELIAKGAVDESTPAWDSTAASLGSWRAHAGRPAGEIPWLAPVFARIRRRLAG